MSVCPTGSKEPLLEQRIPATYLALEECVTSLAADLREPVLKHDEYRKLVTQYMQQKNHRMFRDAAELHQATMFLHENGVLLHYDDATLKELYFLRPQWLCDVLAHVVTVREINPFANNGDEASSLGVSLLNKFELALCWDSRLLLVPPLLPHAEPQHHQLPVRSRSWCSSNRGTPRRAWPAQLTPLPESRGTESPTLIQEPWHKLSVSGRGGRALRRLLLLSYVPCGFWPRLCARLLADQQLAEAPYTLYKLPPEMELDETISKALELSWGWKLWRSGARVCAGGVTMLSLRELPPRRDALLPGPADDEPGDDVYHNVRFRIRQEGTWCELDVQSSACVEIYLPAQVCVIRRDDGLPIAGYQSISLEPHHETLAKVLALVSDHVDLLLEDWYPSLGTRFVHTSEGRCLITRVVPCPDCLRPQQHPPEHDPQLAQAFRRLELGPAEPRRLRLSEESRTSDGDSGVGAESNASSRLGSVEGIGATDHQSYTIATAWTVEQCILAACTSTRLHCAAHAQAHQLRAVAPDTLLLDVEESKRARWEHISRGAVAGRGAFGTVLAATWRAPAAGAINVALKALQPVPPPASSDAAAHHAYKAALSRWEREPTAAACRAYCGLRQELSILSQLKHQHVSENVLVWKMPKPGEDLTTGPLNVHVKLGDYGISRLAPPSGTKGFGGTEGFMAPEIMRYNGEEEYNEKVDCFSYGMLLYEIVTVRQPFEGHEAVKEAVLDGARPSLSPRDLEYPCSILETMRRCWSGAPELRPSAAALVSVAAAPEYAALADAAAARHAAAAAAQPVIGVNEEGIPGWELWYGGGEPERAHTLLTTATNFTHHHTIRVPPDKAEPVMVTAMCRVGNKMWLGDSAGRISVYSLFLVTSKRPEAEGSFVLTELGTATELCCLAAVPSPHGWEVWAGGAGLSSYAVGAGGVCAADVLAPEPRVTLMAAPEDQPFVMVYYDPGVCVYQWSVGCKQQCARLDCSKLVPCSESLQSIALDEHLTEDKCRVTALCALRGELYIGTAWGCVIVADATSLRPLTVFRPYEEDVRVIIPLHPHKEEDPPMIATFGHGYRPLLQRYAPHSSTSTNTHNGYYCLLWQTQHWLPD
uniref:Protein kinase domain-containing protein n=1 Tax=Heliothis virescens TaxID=7102 RepID=A0A2A4KB68_HELVI